MLATAILLATLGLELPQASVEWAANACPGAEIELERAIAAYLRADAGPRVQVEARLGLVDEGPAGLHLELDIASAVGRETHELAATDCERLVDHAALLIAGAIDPFAFAFAQPPPGPDLAAEHHHRPVDVQRPRSTVVVTSTPTQTPTPTLETLTFGPLVLADSPDPAVVDRRPSPTIAGALSVGATGFVGLFPDVGGGVEIEGALERGRFRWQTGASGWFGGRFRSDQANIGADLWALAFASGLCGVLGGVPGGVPGGERVRVPLCAVAGAGFIHAEAVGTVEPRRSTEPWGWAGVEARALILASEKLAIGLGIGAMAALARPAWEVVSPSVRFRVPPVMGVLKLTFETRELRARKKSTALAIKTP